MTGRLLAEMMTGATPFCDPTPYAAERFYSMIPKKPAPDLIAGWEPVSRLREARFGGRRKVGKDHAQVQSLTVRTTLEVGFELTVGSFASLRTSSS